MDTTPIGHWLRITATVDARWDEQTASLTDGAPVGAGPLKLLGGYVQLTMQKGASVILHGPAQFTVLSANSIRLDHGALTAIVPPQAIGFTVESPACSIEDLGTEFGVSVNSDGGDAVEVFKGTVELTPISMITTGSGNASAPSASPAAPVRLVANQSARIQRGQTIPVIETATNHGFVRTLGQARNMEHVIAWWRFDQGHTGELMPSLNGREDAAPACRDISPNGNHLFAFIPDTTPRFSPDVPADRIPFAGAAARGSIDTRERPGAYVTTRDVYTQSRLSHPVGVDLQQIEPTQWSVEVSVKFAAINPLGSSHFQTFVERDGVGADAHEPGRAPFYLQLDVHNHFAATFCDPSKRAHQALAQSLTVRAGQWYHLAVVSDGKTLSLYVDTLDGEGFQRAASEALPSDGSIALAKTSDENAWVIGRAMYNSRIADRFDGLINEVRISDRALEPSEFLYGRSTGKSGQ